VIAGFLIHKCTIYFQIGAILISVSIGRFPRTRLQSRSLRGPLLVLFEGTEKVTTPLTSVPSGRFPRTHLQSPRRENHAPAGLSDCVVSAGVAALHSNQLEYSLRVSFSVASAVPAGVADFHSNQESFHLN